MKSLINFLGSIIKAEGEHSSKRLIALWLMLLVTGIVVFALKETDVAESIQTIFQSLLWLIGALAGVGTVQEGFKHVGNRPDDRG